MDGARLANAAAGLGVGLREITSAVGVDVLSFGGTKNGLLGAEAVVFLNGMSVPAFRFLRKQGMQLASKLRFLAAQFLAILSDDLWLKSAAHANAMARRLAAGAGQLPRVRITRPVQANTVFAVVPEKYIPRLQEKYFFYVWDQRIAEVRWMASFDTTEDDVDGFVAAMREIIR
jgi:threonine aldolase